MKYTKKGARRWTISLWSATCSKLTEQFSVLTITDAKAYAIRMLYYHREKFPAGIMIHAEDGKEVHWMNLESGYWNKETKD